MVLIEPSPEFWVNIRKTWVANGFREPKWCWSGFISDEDALDGADLTGNWPVSADLEAPECPGMAYRYLFGPHPIPKITIDTLVATSDIVPDAITIDIEGAELLALRGAEFTLRNDGPTVWVSVHPDLMERDFGHTPAQLHAFMADLGYSGELLEIDHEEHHLFLPEGA
jgi:FkbM family methyltransferase